MPQEPRLLNHGTGVTTVRPTTPRSRLVLLAVVPQVARRVRLVGVQQRRVVQRVGGRGAARSASTAAAATRDRGDRGRGARPTAPEGRGGARRRRRSRGRTTAAPRPPRRRRRFIAAAAAAAVAVDVAVGAVAVVGAFGARQHAVLGQRVREPEAAELGGARVRGALSRWRARWRRSWRRASARDESEITSGVPRSASSTTMPNDQRSYVVGSDASNGTPKRDASGGWYSAVSSSTVGPAAP